MKNVARRALAVLAVFLMIDPLQTPAYSVLTHEAIIDVVWDSDIRPLLRQRFPNATPEELRQAHAYAYGGSIIQDMGYYPHGSKFFSDLTHYFRSGDFIISLLKNASDLNEYAFALGALSHYAADNDGHPMATNQVVPMLYPHLRKKYGSVVTYEDDPLAHIKTEFAFDVLQVAKGRYAPDAYRDFIGFEVSLPLMNKAFLDTYDMNLQSVFKDEARAANSYRYDISKLIPKATRVAWSLKKDDIQRDLPGMTRKKFLYNIRRSSYEKEWGKDYGRPTPGDQLIAFLIRILPKIGPLQILTFKTPTPAAEQLFEKSFNATVDRYRGLLKEVRENNLQLPNQNFDVGKITSFGQYKLKDKTCDELLDQLAKQDMATVDASLKAQLLAFYADRDASMAGKIHKRTAMRIDQQLKALQDTPASGVLPSQPSGDSLLHAAESISAEP
jgi:Zinc dependent phospholipase C